MLPTPVDVDAWMREMRWAWFLEQHLITQIRAREIDPQALVRVTGV